LRGTMGEEETRSGLGNARKAELWWGGDDEDDRCNRTVDIYQGVESPPVTERNQGRPLHCTYRIRVRPARDDWVVFVRFTRLRIGEPTEDRQRCDGGYVQIVDGYRDSNHSNRDAPGFYCGEIDSPKTFISETPHVKIVFHADSYGQDTMLLDICHVLAVYVDEVYYHIWEVIKR
ncbi:hypothetical protein HPB47_002010, partial [Ixodes persulcatus]